MLVDMTHIMCVSTFLLCAVRELPGTWVSLHPCQYYSPLTAPHVKLVTCFSCRAARAAAGPAAGGKGAEQLQEEEEEEEFVDEDELLEQQYEDFWIADEGKEAAPEDILVGVWVDILAPLHPAPCGVRRSPPLRLPSTGVCCATSTVSANINTPQCVAHLRPAACRLQVCAGDCGAQEQPVLPHPARVAGGTHAAGAHGGGRAGWGSRARRLAGCGLECARCFPHGCLCVAAAPAALGHTAPI